MFKSLAVLTLVVLATSTLEVYGPECAKTSIPSEISYTLSNFGEIPYGQSIIGQINLPNNPELCNITGEESFNHDDSSSHDILLVKRGTCKFTKKVINAQQLGADMIIIYDDKPGDRPSIIMKNDGHGHLA